MDLKYFPNHKDLEEFPFTSALTEMVYVKEGGEFGSLRMSSAIGKLLGYIKEKNLIGISVLPVLDSSSKHVQIPPKDERIINLEKRLGFSDSSYFPEIVQLKSQLDPGRGGELVRLSKAEEAVYSLFTLNNLNALGFPGAWIPYFDAKNGLRIYKTEPIKIVSYCFDCPYGLDEVIKRVLKNDPHSNIVNNIKSTVSNTSRPPACPNIDCTLYRHSPSPGATIYRDIRYRLIQQLKKAEHKIIQDSVDLRSDKLKIAKFIGRLNNGKMYKP